MTAARVGIRNHALLHDFEVAQQRFVRLGIEPYQARRMALYCTLRLTEMFSSREAWEAVDEIAGTNRQANTVGEHTPGSGSSQALPGGL